MRVRTIDNKQQTTDNRQLEIGTWNAGGARYLEAEAWNALGVRFAQRANFRPEAVGSDAVLKCSRIETDQKVEGPLGSDG